MRCVGRADGTIHERWYCCQNCWPKSTLESSVVCSTPHRQRPDQLNCLEAEREYRRAIGLSPDDATGHASGGEFFSVHGRFDEGIAEIKLNVILLRQGCGRGLFNHLLLLRMAEATTSLVPT